MDKIRTTVKVAGHEYTMTSYDTEEHVQRVAKYVDRMINDLSLATRLPPQHVAVLCAMSIADDMIKTHDEVNKQKQKIAELSEKLAQYENGAL